MVSSPKNMKARLRDGYLWIIPEPRTFWLDGQPTTQFITQNGVQVARLRTALSIIPDKLLNIEEICRVAEALRTAIPGTFNLCFKGESMSISVQNVSSELVFQVCFYVKDDENSVIEALQFPGFDVFREAYLANPEAVLKGLQK